MSYNFKKWQKILLGLVIVMTLIGISDSFYLSYKEISQTEINCSLSGGCGNVLSSPYAKMLGIPLSYLGFIFYGGMLAVTLLTLKNKQKIWLKLLSIGGFTGFSMSSYFVFVQLYELVSICQYCMLSAINSTLIFIITTTLFFTAKIKTS